MIAALAAVFVIYLDHHLNLKGVAAGLVVVGSLWFLTTRNPKLGLALLLLYLGLLDGYLKLSTGSTVVTFVRDALLFSLAIGLLVRATVTRQRLVLPPLCWWLIAFAVIVFVEIANPNAGTLAHSIAGAREHLEFIPLFFLTFAFVRTVRALRMFCILLAVVAAVNGLVSWVQFKESPAQFAAWGPGYAARILGTGAFAGAGRTAEIGVTGSVNRPFGLGSEAGDGGLMAELALCGILVLAAFSERRRYQLFAVAMALAAVLGIVTSQGRSVIVGSVLAVVAFAVLTARSRNRLSSFTGLLVAAAVAALVVVLVVGAVGSGGLRYAGLGPTSILNTTSSDRGFTFSDIPKNIATYPFGAGLGSVGPAAGSSGASALTQQGNLDAETEFSFLVIETGVPGMVVLVGFVLTLMYIGFTRVGREPDREARVLLMALIAPLGAVFIQFFVSAETPSVPIGPYLFAIGGLISYWLIELPAVRAREGRQIEAAPAASRVAVAAAPS